MNYALLEQRLGYTFRNKQLLKQALTHRSYLNENRKHDVPHYERLEFLGDAVLHIVLTEYLFTTFPTKPEGELTAMRSYLNSGAKACEIGKFLGLIDFLFLSRGQKADIKSHNTILADTFEAIIGAIHLDQGMEAAREFIRRLLLTQRNTAFDQTEILCTKSRLQEQIQGQLGLTPSYQVIQESGPEHDKRYVVEVYFGGSPVAKGEGSTKLQAEKVAAKNALAAISK